MKTLSIPFTTYAYEGLANTTGILTYADQHLKIEFQTSDSLLGLIKSKIKSESIPISKIITVVNSYKLIHNTLSIEFNELGVLNSFPGLIENKLTIYYKKAHKNMASNIESTILSEIEDISFKEALKSREESQIEPPKNT